MNETKAEESDMQAQRGFTGCWDVLPEEMMFLQASETSDSLRSRQSVFWAEAGGCKVGSMGSCRVCVCVIRCWGSQDGNGALEDL